MNTLIISLIIKNLLIISKRQKEVFCSKLKNKCPSDSEIPRTKKFIKLFDIKIEEELTK